MRREEKKGEDETEWREKRTEAIRRRSKRSKQEKEKETASDRLKSKIKAN